MWLSKSIVFNTLGGGLRDLNKYGKIARVGPNSVLTADPDVLRRIGSARTKYTKDEWYGVIGFSPYHSTMVTMLDNPSHDRIKAKTSSGYNGREIPDFEIAIDSVISNFINTIRRKHLSTKTTSCNVDLANAVRRFTLDMITRLAYGQAFGFQDADGDLYDYITRLDKTLILMSLSQEVPLLRRIVFSRFFFNMFGPKATDENGIGKVIGIAEKVVDESFAREKPANDMMAVINEGLRIKNPLTYGHYKRAPPGGDTINGVFLPGGTLIGHNTVGLTHNEAVFGEDVDVFRPERFLECDEAKRVEMERAMDIIFGAGRWMCAGKVIASYEFSKVYFELLRAFDFQIVNPEKVWDESAYFMFFHTNMWVRITEAEL
ncbi:hypothetical protein Hte_009792 [Hypoxylon texense]